MARVGGTGVQPSSARHWKPRPRLGPCKPVVQPFHPGGAPRQQSKATLVLAQTPHHLLGSLQRKLGTEKPKVIRGDRLEHQCTLVDLNLSVLASRVHSNPPSFTVFEFETEVVHLCSVCLHLAETELDYLCQD
ncbi:hypothetical protein CR513_05455, partial [Mucuna pruriens]